MVPRTGLLPGALIALALLPVAAADELRLLEPRPSLPVVGLTDFCFEPPEGAERIDIFVNGRLAGSAGPPQWTQQIDLGPRMIELEVMAVAFREGAPISRIRETFSPPSFGEYENVDLVPIYPVVRNVAGKYVTDLTRDDFVVRENGVEVPIKYFSSRVESLSVALLLDTSESMVGKLGPLQVASSAFVDALAAMDQAALFSFNHALTRLTPLSREKEAIRSGIWELEPEGGTALYDALLQVISSLSRVPGRKAVFVFSDGLDRHSFASLESVLESASMENVILYTVGSGDDEASLAARDDLRQLARRTGGVAYFVRQTRQLDETFTAILDDLRSQYVMSYDPPPGEEGLRRIEVKVRKRPLKVRHREEYYYRNPQLAGERR